MLEAIEPWVCYYPRGWGKIPLPELAEDKVTLITAMLFPNAILMASDSRETRDNVFSNHAQKLQFVRGHSLAWGCSGELGIIQDFDRWMHSKDWDRVSDWESLRKDAREKLNGFNKDHRESIQASGRQPTDDDVASALIAGYIGQVPNILEISSGGTSYFWNGIDGSSKQYTAIGSARNHFFMALKVCEAYSATILGTRLAFNDRIFWFLTEWSTRADPQSEAPIQRLCITSAGVRSYE